MMNSDDDALVVDMDDNNELNVAHIRAQYEALLPMYGNLWRKMVSSSRPSTTPERQPLSLLPAIENKKATSLRVPTKQCQCPWDESCKGCAEPIVEIVDESCNEDEDEEALSSSSSFSSKDSEDTAPVCFDLSNLRLDDNDEEAKGNTVESEETEFPVTLEPEPFRSGNDDSFAESSAAERSHKSSDHNDDASNEEDSQSSCSSNGSTVQAGWDLSFLRLNDDNDNEQESEKGDATNDDKSKENANDDSTSITSEVADSFEEERKWLKNRQKEKKAMSQAISLLDDSDSDASIPVKKPVNNNNKTRSNMQERPRVVFASDSSSSSSSEEEWNEAKQSTKKEEGGKCMSPTVIVLSDSEEEDGDDEWHDSKDGRDGEKDSLADSEESFGKPSTFARDKKLNKTAESIVSSTPAPRKKKGHSKAAFQKNRQEIADLAFAEFDRVAFDGALRDVELVWSKKLRTTAGLTRLKQISGGGGPTKRTATIELSTKIIDEEHRLRATLLHEMCHAAAWLVDSVSKPPHGECFRKWANIAMQKIPDVLVTTTHDYEISFKYAWACTAPKCGVVIKRHSRSVDVIRHCCGKCKSRLVEIEVPTQKGSNVAHTPRKKAPLSGYNLFVKENSKSVRARLTSERERQGIQAKVTQPEVMKECARLWRETQGSTGVS